MESSPSVSEDSQTVRRDPQVAAERPQQVLITMRHGQRLDDIEPDWRVTTDRPWDPPLSPEGLRQARAAAEVLQKYEVDQLVSSPFVRCLQTTKELERDLHGCPAAEIAFPFCEVLGRQFLTGKADLPSGHPSEWEWPGLDEIGWPVSSVHGLAEWPDCPESIEEAHRRYAAALHAVANGYEGKNVLIVTHGEAIGRSINWLQPHAIVYQAAHCGFTIACRQKGEDGQWGEWQLGDPEDMQGVLWTI
ncbi:hypothetical protein WJX74_000851 [Apatococcus lobatus]|uniref:Phosphoglycerate mutase n=1 Tax=Apatococcus lobatus TaxID=904363 RepID=A0AAW1RB20_9CHLO